MKLRRISKSELPITRNVDSWLAWQRILREGLLNPNEISGSFNARNSGINSLKDVPNSIGYNFDVSNNLLTSLQYGPQIVDGSYACNNNMLRSLIGAPSKVGGSFKCFSNQLESLEGIPSIMERGYVDADNNKLTNLQNIYKMIKHINGSFFVNENPIKSHILSLLLINGLNEVRGDGVPFEIIDKHLEGNKDVLECQEELISNGFKEYAKL